MNNSCGKRCTKLLFWWLFFTPPLDATKSWLAMTLPRKTIWVRDHWVWLSELPRFNKIGVLFWNCLQVEGVCPTALFSSWPGLSVRPRSGGTETSHQLIPKSGTAESGGTRPHLATTWRHVNVMVWSVIEKLLTGHRSSLLPKNLSV